MIINCYRYRYVLLLNILMVISQGHNQPISSSGNIRYFNETRLVLVCGNKSSNSSATVLFREYLYGGCVCVEIYNEDW